MKTIYAAAAVLMLLTGAAHAVSAKQCGLGQWKKLSQSDVESAGLEEKLRQFNGGIKKARESLGVTADVEAIIFDCRFYPEDLFDVRHPNLSDPSGIKASYGVYVSAYLLKHGAETPERAAITGVCEIRNGSEFPPLNADARREEHLRAQRCMANVVGDIELVRWIDRILPAKEFELFADMGRRERDSLQNMERLIRSLQ